MRSFVRAYVGPMLGPCWVIWWAMWGSMEVSGMKNLTPTENFSVKVIFGAILYLTETSWNSILIGFPGGLWEGKRTFTKSRLFVKVFFDVV